MLVEMRRDSAAEVEISKIQVQLQERSEANGLLALALLGRWLQINDSDWMTGKSLEFDSWLIEDE